MNEWIKEGQVIQNDGSISPDMGVKQSLSEEVPFEQVPGGVRE
jgi:hypothetical protein